MTEHITQEQALEAADVSGLWGCEFSEFESRLCAFANTAIQHYIDQQAKELPVLPDHPEPRIMKWSALEIEAIQAYGAACAAHAREMALSEAARVAAATVCDTHIPTGVQIYGSRAGKAIEALKGK